LRIKEQETRLTLQEYDDDNADNSNGGDGLQDKTTAKKEDNENKI